MYVVSYKQVIDLIHRTGSGVLDRQYAVLAQSVIHHTDYTLKGVVEHDLRYLKEFLGSNLGVCALTSLTGHYGTLGERSGLGVDKAGQGLVEWGVFLLVHGLICLAYIKDGAVQHAPEILQVLGQLFGYSRQHLTLA